MEVRETEYYIGLNKIIETIEKNLTNEINYKELAKIIGTSEYTLQRIFCFLTGITLTDYIRKRRLSKAGEDILTNKEKLIDIAIRYGYDSPTAFSRAFQKMYGIKPSDIKKKNTVLKSFPKMEFKEIKNDIIELEYRVLELPEQIFYGKSTNVIFEEDKDTIRDLWNKCKEDKTLEYIINHSNQKELYYASSKYIYEDQKYGQMKYYILGKTKREDFEKLKIPKATWLVFKINSKEQNDILKMINTIYIKWLSTSNYNVLLPYPELEIYYGDYCEYCIAVEN